MLKLANVVIALGLVLIAIPVGFSLYADYSQARAISGWEKIALARAEVEDTDNAELDKINGTRKDKIDIKSLVEKAPIQGKSVALLEIPALDRRYDILEGATWVNLTKGPARVSSSALIGAEGSAVISGHRTMYGAPFHDLDRLVEGDLLRVYTKKAVFVYKVAGKRIVKPNDLDEITKKGTPRLILSTCDPVFSAKHRLLVIGELADAELVRLSK